MTLGFWLICVLRCYSSTDSRAVCDTYRNSPIDRSERITLRWFHTLDVGILSRRIFLQLFQDFYDGKITISNINGSLITSILNKQSPKGSNDFRPISLTNTCLKFLTKLLANRLQKVILRCIHKNQYGFLKSRSIQDCIAWTLEYIH